MFWKIWQFKLINIFYALNFTTHTYIHSYKNIYTCNNIDMLFIHTFPRMKMKLFRPTEFAVYFCAHLNIHQSLPLSQILQQDLYGVIYVHPCRSAVICRHCAIPKTDISSWTADMLTICQVNSEWKATTTRLREKCVWVCVCDWVGVSVGEIAYFFLQLTSLACNSCRSISINIWKFHSSRVGNTFTVMSAFVYIRWGC